MYLCVKDRKRERERERAAEPKLWPLIVNIVKSAIEFEANSWTYYTVYTALGRIIDQINPGGKKSTLARFHHFQSSSKSPKEIQQIVCSSFSI